MLRVQMPRPRKARPPLTKRTIDAAKAQTRDQFLWDGAEHGLGLKVTPAGSKIFILQKTVQGRLKRITLGAYGDLTLEAARKRAGRLNGEIANGRDPVADARAQRAERERVERSEKTVSDLWDRYWLEIVSSENRPSTAAEKRRMWKSRIEPAIGSLKLKDVTDQDVGAIVRGPVKLDDEGRPVRGRGAAGNLYRLLHHLFAKALVWGMRPRELGNPLENLAEPKVPRRERLLKSGEVGALLTAIQDARVKKPEQESKPKKLEHETVLAAIEALILTGARTAEVLNLRWDDVRKEELELHLRDTKTGFSRRPISPEAMAVIERVTRLPGCPFVFRSPRYPDLPVEYTAVRLAFKRMADAAGVTRCTLHTVRHWFSTATAKRVGNPRVGMSLTGHKSHAAYMGYVHNEEDEARALADEIGAFAASLRRRDNVVPLQKSEL
jgi:integrase